MILKHLQQISLRSTANFALLNPPKKTGGSKTSSALNVSLAAVSLFTLTAILGTQLPLFAAFGLAGVKLSNEQSGVDLPLRIGTEVSPFGHFLAARHAQYVQRPALGVRLLEVAQDRLPESDLLNYTRFTLLGEKGEIVEMGSLAEQLVERDPGDLEALEILAALAANSGDIEKAAEFYEAFDEDSFYYTVLIPKYAFEAWKEAGRGNEKAAFDAIDELEQATGLEDLATNIRLLVYEFLGETDKARTIYENLYIRYPDSRGILLPRLFLLTQRFYLSQGNEDYVMAQCEDIDGSLPPNVISVYCWLFREGKAENTYITRADARSGLAETLASAAAILNSNNRGGNSVGSLSLTYRSLDFAFKALVLDPRSSFARMEAARRLVEPQLARYDDALTLLAEIPEDDPYALDAKLLVSRIYQRQDRPEAAFDLLSGLQGQEPHWREVGLELGNQLLTEKRLDEAIDALERVAERIEREAVANPAEESANEKAGRAVEPTTEEDNETDPGTAQVSDANWLLYYLLGQAYAESDRWPDAENYFLKGLEIAPDHPLLLNYLAYTWVERGEQLERAEEMLKRALEVREEGFIIDSLAWAYYQMGRYEEALVQQERAIAMVPYDRDPTLNHHLGDMYWRVGRKREAYFQWARALSFDPTEKERRQIEAKLRMGLDNALEYLESEETLSNEDRVSEATSL